MFDPIQECPHCGGLINREHFVQFVDEGAVVTMLYCEWCDAGRESMWERVARNVLRLEFYLDYFARTEPESLGKFLAELRARIAA